MTRQAAIIELLVSLVLLGLGALIASSSNASIGVGYWFWSGFLGFRLCQNWVTRKVTFTGVHVRAHNIPDLFVKQVLIQALGLGLKFVGSLVVGVFGGGLWRFIQLIRAVV